MYFSIKSIKFTVFISALIFGSFVLQGCIHLSKPGTIEQPELERIDPKSKLINASKSHHPGCPGPPPFLEKLEPVSKSAKKDSRLFSFVFNKTEFGVALAALTKSSDLNISVESGVNLVKPVTVRLKNVTLNEALEMIVTKGAGYVWDIKEDCIYIKRFVEKIYNFDYLDLTGTTEIAVGGDMLASSVEDSGVAGKFKVNAEKKKEAGNIWQYLQEMLEGFKSPEGLLRVNRTGGVIYMSDYPEKVEAMVNFLDSISEVLHRQVYIDANIYEVRLSDKNKYGINWSNLATTFTSSSGFWPDSFNLNVNSGSIVLSGQSSVTAALDFLRTQGDVSVLSNPHLSVMNRQSALLTVGYQFPYGSIDGVDRDTETGMITYGSEIKRAILGIQLGITPQISSGGIITLHIVPTITRIQREEDVSVPVAANEVQVISNPVIDLQELFTTVRVKHGQTIVLAGLISQVKDIKHEGLPFLGSIPFLGRLFQNVEDNLENKELVIFITPYVRNPI
ncbi:MSHA biogenesis protein MshL [Desulfosarcina sp. BuS5]|uniref:type II secretion system protein GspD n=1 Tax=Desulfosarcina sp. BuS5 TaxID=933262 RepID=UPI00048802D5|nr:hypothetical protein [Desulfosarcina sp. BuS5]WDN90580.1 MSHA biogenesis protein MshL [Desulfosarcina sp. BuS5]